MGLGHYLLKFIPVTGVFGLEKLVLGDRKSKNKKQKPPEQINTSIQPLLMTPVISKSSGVTWVRDLGQVSRELILRSFFEFHFLQNINSLKLCLCFGN